MRVLRIHAAAVEEASEAAAWYEKERIGLGSEFERALDAALDLLEQDIVPLLLLREFQEAAASNDCFSGAFPIRWSCLSAKWKSS